MIKLKEAIIVEGKYDKIKLSSFIDATIITTEGFHIFQDKEKVDLIRTLAKKNGIVIMTDGDTSGFKIRNYLKGCIKDARIINVYIPDVFGKEKRKVKASSEGKLGVEGMPIEIIREALNKAGVLEHKSKTGKKITKIDFFEDGLTGQKNSAKIRSVFLKKANLPEKMATNSLLEIINSLYDYEEYKELIKKTMQSL